MIPNLWLFEVNVLTVVYCINEFISIVVAEGDQSILKWIIDFEIHENTVE